MRTNQTTQNFLPSSTWANRPDATLYGLGHILPVSDVGQNGSFWFSNGTNWVRDSDLLLVHDSGSLAAPIATISGTTAALFTLPLGNIKIPANMLIAGRSQVYVEHFIVRVGANATADSRDYFGTANSSSDQAIRVNTLNATDNFSDWCFSGCTLATTTSITRLNVHTLNADVASGMSDVSSNINSAADMYINIGITTANASDSFKLIGYSVRVRI